MRALQLWGCFEASTPGTPNNIKPPPNISYQEEQTLQELLTQVFFPTPKANGDDHCNGCLYALLYREVLLSSKLLGSIIGPISRALSSGQFENLKIDLITLNPQSGAK